MKKIIERASKILALALCLAVPMTSTAAEIGRFAGQAAFRGFTVPVSRLQQPLILEALDLHFSAGNFDLPASLNGLALSRGTAATLLAEAIAAGPEAARRHLAQAGLSGDAIDRIVPLAESARRAAESDPRAAAALARLQAATGPTVKPNHVGALLERLKSAFPRAQRDDLAPEAEGISAGTQGGTLRASGLSPSGGQKSSRQEGLGPRPGLAESGKASRPEFNPSSKKIAALLSLANNDVEAGYKAASDVLADKEERRIEVRLSALRVLDSMPVERHVPILLSVADGDFNWYMKREAAQRLGARAKEIKDREPVLKVLAKTAKSSNDSLKLMSRWALEQLGADPGPETGVTETKEWISSVRDLDNRPPTRQPVQTAPPQVSPALKALRRISTLMLAAALFFFVYISFVPHNPQPKAPVTPPAIVQVEKQAPSQAKIEVKNDPNAALKEIAENTKRSAEAMERASKAIEKAAEPKEGGGVMGFILNIAMWIGIMLGINWFLTRKGGPAGQAAQQIKQMKAPPEKPTTRFSDIAGIDDSLVEVQEIVDYLRDPRRYVRMGAKIPKGVLLEGPPGTGKTLLAKALAGETNAAFFPVSGSDFIEMFVGVGAARVRDLFQKAAQNGPAIIFIDEIDAVGKSRGGRSGFASNDEREQTINAILAEMDGFDSSSGVIVMAATNRVDTLDSALTRPGRFDRTIHVGLPDVLGREAILQLHALKARLGPDANLRYIAKRTTGLSGAYLENVVNEAALLAARRGEDSISLKALDEAVDRATVGQKRNLFIPADLKKRISYHESGHVLAGMLAGGKTPNKLTNVPHGGKALGFADPGGEDDAFLYTQDELEARLVGILGGMVAEELIYGKTSTGPGSDLEQGNRIARLMVQKLGMSRKVGMVISGSDPESPIGSSVLSEQTKREMDEEVRRVLEEAHSKATRLLTSNRETLERMTSRLLERETLTTDEIEEIVKGAPLQ